MEPSPSFGYWVRRRRKALDLTQEALARQVACALATIKKIEQDERRPSRLMAERLADSLHIPSEERSLFIQAARAERSPERLPSANSLTITANIKNGSEHGNLPLPAKRLIGRQAELAEIHSHLQDPETRLLTLTGPAGVGKTRLALQAALEVQGELAKLDGAYLIDLAPLSREELVLPAVAATLGISLSGTPEQALLSALRRQRLLLFFDNCEHLVEACAQLVHLIITNCPQVKVLATSRQSLGVAGEMIYPVQTFPVLDMQLQPDLICLSQNEAVSLFTERAEAIQSGFALSEANARSVGEICLRLDGLPLAIELAAARVNVLSPAQIAERLDDRLHLLTYGNRSQHAHQQTLRSTLDWSHALLTPGERVLFRRLAVFDGSFSLEAAESICADQELIAAQEVLDLLARLIDHSLVKVVAGEERMRYRLLETMRQYAGERLAASGEEEDIQLRHISYYQSLMAQAVPHFHHADEATWCDRLELEVDNLRGALEHGLSLDPQAGAQLTIDLGCFWDVRGYHAEGREWTKRYLDVLGGTPAEMGTKADLYDWAAHFAGTLCILGDWLELAGRGLELANALGDARRIAYALLEYGSAEFKEDVIAQPALETFEKVLSLFRQVGDDWGAARCLYMLGHVYECLCERAMATRCELESLQKYHQIGDQRGAARVHFRLGWMAKWYGDLEAARGHFAEGLAIDRQLGDLPMMSWNLLGLGEVDYRQGRYAQAQQHLAESDFLNSKVGNRENEVCILYYKGNIERLEGNDRQARELLCQALGLCREYGLTADAQLAQTYLGKLECGLGNYRQAARMLEDAFLTKSNTDTLTEIYLEILEATVGLASAMQMDDQAAQLLGAAEAYRQSKEMVRYPIDAAEIEPMRQGLQARLGEEGFAEAYAQGQSLTLEEAVRQAQEMLAGLKSDTSQPATS